MWVLLFFNKTHVKKKGISLELTSSTVTLLITDNIIALQSVYRFSKHVTAEVQVPSLDCRPLALH